MPIEQHDSGDAAFKRFASTPDSALDAAINGWPRWGELVTACDGDTLLARVLFHHVGEHAMDYVDTRPPVLEGLSPRECLATHSTRNRLRESLMRWP